MSGRKIWTICLLGLFLTVLGGAPAQALLIDDFSTPAGGQAVAIINGSAGSAAFSTVAATVLGGWRQIGVEIESTAGSNSIKASVFASDTPSNYQLEESIRVDGLGTILYDANAAGLNVNLSGFAGIRLVAAENDLTTVYSLTLETFSGGTSSISQTIAPGAGDIDFWFSSLVGTVNLADIDRIIFTINPERAGDVYLERIETFVPAPATLILLGSGLLGLTGWRRLRKN